MRITLTEEEISALAHIMDHFTDYMHYDDRPDHGLGILKEYRTMKDDQKIPIIRLAGRLLRLRRKIQRKHYLEKYGRENT
jgi:hypothetical protein